MRFSKMSLHMSHIQSNCSTQRTRFWSDMDGLFWSGGYSTVFCLLEHTVDAPGGFVLS